MTSATRHGVGGGALGQPSVALVHDYLTQRGGAERVVLSMLRAFPDAPVHTSLYDPAGTYDEFAVRDVRPLPLDRVPAFRQHHRLALPLLAPAYSRLEVPGDVVVCSSTGWAHGARVEGRKVVYCNSPAKWLHAPDRYFASGWPASRLVMTPLRPFLLRWDAAAAASADRYLSNSSMVQRWVREVYGLDSEVLHPPNTLDPDGPARVVPGLEPGFLLCVARLLPYKNVGAVVEAVAARPDVQLVVVGTGPLESALRSRATSNVTFLGRVGDDELRWLYRSSRAVVSAAHEDFGLMPLEAACFGRPVAVLRWGGFLDTVVEGVTGVFFDEPSPHAIGHALRTLDREPWDEASILLHAGEFTEERFVTRLREIVAEEATSTGSPTW